jgi:hypothetical protein
MATDVTKSIMKWAALIIALGTIGAGALKFGTYIYATREEVTKLEKRQIRARGADKLQKFQIERLEVQVQNVENIARRTDMNVEKLLIQDKMQPAPMPALKPLPTRSSLDMLGEDKPEKPGDRHD